MSELNETVRTVLERRYLRQDASGEITETPDELWERVAGSLASVEENYGDTDPGHIEKQFLELLKNREFLPNSPTLINAGTNLNQLAACFVLPVEDSIESIFETIKQTALIHQSGGGTGFSFSKLRPSGDVVNKTGGVASGPVSFMRIFDNATEEIKQGGRRRGANMAVLRVDHPDIREFIEAKFNENALRNFNLSVATTESFWSAYERNEPFPLLNPRTDKQVDTVAPRDLLDRMAEVAWETGDPGILFLNTINKHNPTPELGRIEATNPCGEVPLLPFEACVLGSIDLSKMTVNKSVNWAKLERTVRLAVRFLDNAIETSSFPVQQINDMMKGNRKIGLGVMGFHDMLVNLEISYDSNRAVEFAEDLMAYIDYTAREASRDLAEEREPFPNWESSIYDEPVRNATRTTIAPTGSISLIANCSASIEPIYNVAYTKQVMGGLDVHSEQFVQIANERGFYSDELMEKIRSRSTLRGLPEVPDDVKKLFSTAHDIPPDRHLEIQSAFQKYTDNAVSKTVNLPKDATVENVKNIYLSARERNVKGVTVFRSHSRRQQVLGEDPLKEECVSECDYTSDR